MVGTLERWFAAIASWTLPRGRGLLIACTILGVISLFIALPPRVDTNLLNLLPDSNSTVRAIKRVDEEEGGVNVLTLVFELAPDGSPTSLDPFLDDLTEQIAALPEVEFALHEVEPALATQIGLLQLDPNELSELVVRMKGALALGPAMNPFVAQKLMDMGPVTDKIAKASKGGIFGGVPGRGRVIVRPKLPASDPIQAQRVLSAVRGVVTAADPAGHGVSLLWEGGAYRHTVEDVEGISWDLYWTTFVSAFLVVVTLVFAFRSFRALVIVFPPLILANIVTLAWVKLALGALNTYTSFGMAMLTGLGIEHAVHLVGRYRELRARGTPVEDAIVETWSTTGPPCLTSAGTSIAGFSALVLAQFGGFRQLGLLLAVGLLLCLIANIVLLPPLIARFERFAPPLRGTSLNEASVSLSTYRFAPIGALVLLVASTVIVFTVLPKIGFETDLSEMRRAGMSWNEMSDTQRELVRQSYSPVLATWREPLDTTEIIRDIDARIARGEMPHVAAVVGIDRVLPRDQAARNDQIRELVRLMDSPDLRYLPPPVVQNLLAVKGLPVRDLTRDDLPPGVLHMLGARNPNVSRLLLLPQGNLWDVVHARALSDEITAALPGVEIAGEQIGVAAMFEVIRDDMPMVVATAFLIIVVLAWLDLRKPIWTLSAVLSLTGGMIWALVAMWLGDIKFSTVNLTAIPILMGVAVDAVIHLTHRLREEGPGGIRRALGTTGVAVAIGAATNIASFWALTLGSNRGVASLGWIVLLGLISVTSMGTLVLVTLWAAGWRLTRRAPSQSAPSA